MAPDSRFCHESGMKSLKRTSRAWRMHQCPSTMFFLHLLPRKELTLFNTTGTFVWGLAPHRRSQRTLTDTDSLSQVWRFFFLLHQWIATDLLAIFLYVVFLLAKKKKKVLELSLLLLSRVTFSVDIFRGKQRLSHPDLHRKHVQPLKSREEPTRWVAEQRQR